MRLLLGWRGVLIRCLPVFLYSSCLFAPPPFSEQQWRQQVLSQDPTDLYAPHHRDGRYFNPWQPEERRGFSQVIRWKLTRSQDYTEEEETFLPQFQAGLADRLKGVPMERNILVWIGHGTFLLRLNGSWWLTDPMLSERALLPKRVSPPALTGEELTTLQGSLNVVISHNHYDHLDADTISMLPRWSRFYVPLGVGDLIRTLHGGEVVELDWWQRTNAGDVELVCLPAQHWSLRLGSGRNDSLWASFLLRSGDTSVYFGGDSGSFVGYREIGRVFDDIDYALLPITAYHPRWFMHYPHLSVQEALQAFDDLDARYFVPSQWGTFRLGDEPPGYPLMDLNRALTETGRMDERYLRPALGEIIILDAN